MKSSILVFLALVFGFEPGCVFAQTPAMTCLNQAAATGNLGACEGDQNVAVSGDASERHLPSKLSVAPNIEAVKEATVPGLTVEKLNPKAQSEEASDFCSNFLTGVNEYIETVTPPPSIVIEPFAEIVLISDFSVGWAMGVVGEILTSPVSVPCYLKGAKGRKPNPGGWWVRRS